MAEKTFPYEGLSEARPVLTAMQNSWTFSEDDLSELFERNQIDLSLFPNAGELKTAFAGWSFGGNTVKIIQDKVPIAPSIMERVNAMYDSIDIEKEIGNIIYMR